MTTFFVTLRVRFEGAPDPETAKEMVNHMLTNDSVLINCNADASVTRIAAYERGEMEQEERVRVRDALKQAEYEFITLSPRLTPQFRKNVDIVKQRVQDALAIMERVS